MVYLESRICPGKWDSKILWDFEIKTDYSILVRRADLVVINKKKWTCYLVDFIILVNSKVRKIRIKEMEKLENTCTLPES